MASKLTLISYETCPFVMRAAAVLHQKNVPFDVQFIDVKNKPEWFLKMSPLGKVPLLKTPENRKIKLNLNTLQRYYLSRM